MISTIYRWSLASIIVTGCSTSTQRQTLPPTARMAPQLISSKSLPFEKDLSTSKETNPEKIHQKLEDYYKNKKTDAAKWWAKYNQARLWAEVDPILSCDIFNDLSKEKDFPLFHVAQLRAVQNCLGNKDDLTIPNFRKLADIRWLKKLALEAGLTFSESSNNPQLSIDLYVEKSKISTHRPEKIELMHKSIALATALGDAEKIDELNDRLYWLSPSHIPNPSANQWAKVAYDLRRQRKFNQAIEQYQKIVNYRRSSFKQKYRALGGIRMSYKNARDKKSYVEATKKMAAFVYPFFKRSPRKYAKDYLDAVTTYARTIWTEGQSRQAEKMLRALAGELHRKIKLDEVYWLLGRLYEERKNYSKAVGFFALAEQDCQSRCHLRDKILWIKAWNLRKQKKHEEALHVYNQMIARERDKLPKIEFWRAKTLWDLDQKNEAMSSFEELIEKDPIGYYGILAHREIKRPFVPPASTDVPDQILTTVSSESGVFSRSEDGEFANWLISVGENELARNFLDEVSRKYQKKKSRDLTLWSEILNYFSRSEGYIHLFKNLGQLDSDLRNSLLLLQPQIIFPQPFSDIVQSSSKKQGVSVEMIYSIMRQESAFNPLARSGSDAFGLMQLLPSIAKRKSSVVDVEYAKAEDLYTPKINIELGSALLKELKEKFNGQFILSTASYNASEKAIHNWVKHRFEGDPIEFIEDIPYEETQTYIKLVLRNLVFYTRLNSEKPFFFPEHCLQNIQSQKI